MEQPADIQPSPDNQLQPTAPTPAIKAGWIRATIFFVAAMLVVILAQVAFALILSLRGVDMNNMAAIMQSPSMIAMQIASLGAVLLLMYIFRRWLDRLPFVTLGFQFGGTERLHLVIGFIWGVALILSIFGVLLISGLIEITEWHTPSGAMLATFIVMIFAATQEEVITRGYMLNNYMKSINKYLALLLVSVLFAAVHGANPNVSLVALLNIILAGILLGIYYVHRKNLWFPIGLHIGWNVFQGIVMGSPVSGIRVDSLLSLKFVGNEWLTGGDFGFEASLVTSVVLAVATVLIHLQFRQPKAAVLTTEIPPTATP